jgi:hypothetical protein
MTDISGKTAQSIVTGDAIRGKFAELSRLSTIAQTNALLANRLAGAIYANPDSVTSLDIQLIEGMRRENRTTVDTLDRLVKGINSDLVSAGLETGTVSGVDDYELLDLSKTSIPTNSVAVMASLDAMRNNRQRDIGFTIGDDFMNNVFIYGAEYLTGEM